MITLTHRHAAIGTLTLVLSGLAVVAALTTPARLVQAQPNPLLMTQQPPSSCVCAPPTSVFGGGGPQIANCQCGALNCAVATAAGGATLQCAR